MIHDLLSLAADDTVHASATDVLARRRGGGGGGKSTLVGPIILIVAVVLGSAAWRHREKLMRSLNSLAGGLRPPAGPGPHAPGSGPLPPPSPQDVQAALNPQTPPPVLAQMVNTHPGLRPYVAMNPAAEPGLLHFLGSLRDPAVDQALHSRGPNGPGGPNTNRPPTSPAPPAPLMPPPPPRPASAVAFDTPGPSLSTPRPQPVPGHPHAVRPGPPPGPTTVRPGPPPAMPRR